MPLDLVRGDHGGSAVAWLGLGVEVVGMKDHAQVPIRLGVPRVGLGAVSRLGHLAPHGRFEGVGVKRRQRRPRGDGCFRSRRWRFRPAGEGQPCDYRRQTQGNEANAFG